VKGIVPLLVLALPLALAMLVGFPVLVLAGRRPRVASAVIAGAVATGLGAIGYVAASDGGSGARVVLGVGLGLVVLGCPAPMLIAAARTRPSPAGAAWWGVTLLVYTAACYLLALALAVVVHLTSAPPGSLR
jgi:hypothetical protein